MQLTSDTNTLPDISPDGQWIACSFFRDDEPDRPPAIAIYPIGGGSAQKIFDRPPGSEHQVAWTADGKALDYIVNRGGVGNIWRQSRSGGPPAPITSFTSQMIFFFAYSPDGNTAVLGRGKDADDLVVITDAK
jgi:Tol biopolymer transport system component